MEEYNRSFKGIWIPKEIWLDERLTALDKFILVEIDSLDNDEGCTASNEYLAEFCDCAVSKVSRSISKLKKYELIKDISFNGRTRCRKTSSPYRQVASGASSDSPRTSSPKGCASR